LFLITSLTLSITKTGTSSIMRGRQNTPTQQKQTAPPPQQKPPAPQNR
jgi:hypothetical protein